MRVALRVLVLLAESLRDGICCAGDHVLQDRFTLQAAIRSAAGELGSPFRFITPGVREEGFSDQVETIGKRPAGVPRGQVAVGDSRDALTIVAIEEIVNVEAILAAKLLVGAHTLGHGAIVYEHAQRALDRGPVGSADAHISGSLFARTEDGLVHAQRKL